MKRVVIAVACAVALLAGQGVAQAQQKKGDKEITMNALVMTFFGGGSTSTVGTVFFNVGVFTSDRLEVGGGPTISFFSSGGDTDTSGGANFFTRYFLGAQAAKVKPFVGGDYNIFDFEAAGDSQFASGLFGVRNYISERAALDFTGQYGVNVKHAGDQQNLTFRVGITVLF